MQLHILFTPAILLVLVRVAVAGHHPPQAACNISPSSSRPWNSLPPTPSLDGLLAKSDYVQADDGTRLWYGLAGRSPQSSLHDLHKPPLLFLHSGLANSNYFSNQVRCLLPYFSIILTDLRGHGRSFDNINIQKITYERMSKDVLTLLDALNVPSVIVVAWADGANAAIQLALTDPSRIERLFSYGASYDPSNSNYTSPSMPVVQEFYARTKDEWMTLAPQDKPKDSYPQFVTKIATLWSTSPKWTRDTFRRIQGVDVVVSGGEQEEVLKKDVPLTLRSWIPTSKLVMLPGVSHFAVLQDPASFNNALKDFLGIGPQ
ncbi:Alpha/Beta hydrolase protein [Flagelloscypha sp. PMI_526]|nr:Alpha/Beta hydrolase protein [Flagelloscypha sp. PMI_526]